MAALETRTKLLPLPARHRSALTFVIRHDVHAQCVNFATSMVDISNLTVGGKCRWGVLAATARCLSSWPQAVCHGLGRFPMFPTRPLMTTTPGHFLCTCRHVSHFRLRPLPSLAPPHLAITAETSQPRTRSVTVNIIYNSEPCL